jgi:hypothetical protein
LVILLKTFGQKKRDQKRVPQTKEHGAGTEIKDEEGSCRTGHQRLRSRIGI